MKVNKITQTDNASLEVLCHIASPPKQLYVLGDLEPLQHANSVSIVGSAQWGLK